MMEPDRADRGLVLAGRRALITGGNAGIGLGIAEALGRAGADVAIWGTNADKNAAAATHLTGMGIRAHAEQCDVSDEAAVDRAFAATVEAMGPLDCVVANAGVMGHPADPGDVTLADWQRVLAVNLNGTFLTLRAATRHVVEHGRGGALVAVGSIVAEFGAPAQVAYATSKAGIMAMVRSFAVALARHDVRVNALLPGWTATDLLATPLTNQRLVDNTIARTPMRRHATPHDYAAAAVFLADPRHVFHTGSAMVVDGGYSIF